MKQLFQKKWYFLKIMKLWCFSKICRIESSSWLHIWSRQCSECDDTKWIKSLSKCNHRMVFHIFHFWIIIFIINTQICSLVDFGSPRDFMGVCDWNRRQSLRREFFWLFVRSQNKIKRAWVCSLRSHFLFAGFAAANLHSQPRLSN